MSQNKITVKTKVAFGIGATGEGATNWIFAGLTFFFYNQVLGLSGSLTGLAVLIAIIFVLILGCSSNEEVFVPMDKISDQGKILSIDDLKSTGFKKSNEFFFQNVVLQNCMIR